MTYRQWLRNIYDEKYLSTKSFDALISEITPLEGHWDDFMSDMSIANLVVKIASNIFQRMCLENQIKDQLVVLTKELRRK